MATPAVRFLAASIVNAVTFELLVDLPITVIVQNTGPWASSVGIVGTLLFVTACIIYAFPDIVCKMTKERLYRAFTTLLRHLLPWIGLRLLWIPGSYLLCRLTVKLFSRRCHRLKFLNIAQLIFGGLCLYASLHRTGLTADFECKLLSFWRQTFIYHLFSGCCCTAGADTIVDVEVKEIKTKKEKKSTKRERSKSRSNSKTRRNSRKGRNKY